MRYYIEAFYADGSQILGNLDGQAALGEVRYPTRCNAWQVLPIKSLKAKVWKLVDAKGNVLATKERLI